MHEVYLTIWKQAGSFQPGKASPISWLAVIARNRAIDWRRTNSAGRTVRIEFADDIPDETLATDETMIATERDGRLHRCLDELEERQRKAIHAAFFNGLTYAELAERSAVPLGTMKSWVRRGLARLKDCLDDG